MNRMSERLRAVCDIIRGSGTLADIGCDHAYVSIELVESGRFERAIAADVRKGPLEIAAGNIDQNGLSEKIAVRLSDGFSSFRPGEADTAVIAGMGGHLICRILTQHETVTGSLKELILEPQSDVGFVRKTLLERPYAGQWFSIEDEVMVKEDGKYYPVIRAAASEKPQMPLSEIQYCFGPVLLEKRHDVLKQYLFHKRQRYEMVLERLPAHLRQRREEIEEELRLVDAALNVYEQDCKVQ